MNGTGELSLSMIFTAFMVMLGPVKIVGPFAALTSAMEEAEARRLAGKAIGYACLGGLVAAVIGQNTLRSWDISPAMLHLTAGIVLMLVAVKAVLAQYEHAPEPVMPSRHGRNLALAPLAFPTILTPHGIAILILVLAVTASWPRQIAIVGLFFGVMLLNWLAMWSARFIVRRGGIGLAIMGSVLAVLQIALSVKMMVESLRVLRVIPT